MSRLGLHMYELVKVGIMLLYEVVEGKRERKD